MCKQGSNIYLCTCLETPSPNLKDVLKNELRELKKSDTYNLVKWKLYRFIKKEWIGLDGMLIRPAKILRGQITSEYIRNQMNSRDCFDFTYKPKNGDCIIFETVLINKSGKKAKKQKDYEFISLIFNDGAWTIDFYDTFYTIIKEINRGIVKHNSK